MENVSPASGAAGLPEPPFTDELLADFHAGALDARLAAHIDGRLAADPAGRRLLAALEATRTRLAKSRDTPPPVQLPDSIAARIDDLLGGLDGR